MSTTMTNGATTLTNGVGHSGQSEEPDVVIVGMGFGGIYLLHRLRKLGYNVKAIESGGGLGGVWWWNNYPGARVDTSSPFYEFADKALWEDWDWDEYFPGQEELAGYFEHVDKIWSISKDVQYNTTVTAAEFDATTRKWSIFTDKGETLKSRFLILATGFASKIHIPYLKGLESFQGMAFHTARWPKGEDPIDFKGKRVAVIGTGASGVQVIQEVGPIAKQLTVFQRTPNTALPMRQKKLTKESQRERKQKEYTYLMKLRRCTNAGWDYDPLLIKTFDVSPEERLALYESLWEKGGFYPWLGNYGDLIVNQDANDLMYKFWRDKVRERITRKEYIEDLAPTHPVHPFGTKRPSLEQAYYEVYNQPNVELVNLKKQPIVEITPTGIRTAEKEYDLDIIVLATGFDAGTGSISKIDVHGLNGLSIQDKWAAGAKTWLGMATSGFPNMFYIYGPQSPCAFSIGPTNAEIQGDWLVSCLESMKLRDQTRIEALPSAEEKWGKITSDQVNATLLPKADSWYMGANIPGKIRESMNYVGGLPSYTAYITESANKGYEGFELA